jgi:hypothetical protein
MFDKLDVRILFDHFCFYCLRFFLTAANRAQQFSIQRGGDVRASKHRDTRRAWCCSEKRRSYYDHQHKDTRLAQGSK